MTATWNYTKVLSYLRKNTEQNVPNGTENLKEIVEIR